MVSLSFSRRGRGPGRYRYAVPLGPAQGITCNVGPGPKPPVVCTLRAVGALTHLGAQRPGGPPARRGPCFLYKKAGGKNRRGFPPAPPARLPGGGPAFFIRKQGERIAGGSPLHPLESNRSLLARSLFWVGRRSEAEEGFIAAQVRALIWKRSFGRIFLGWIFPMRKASQTSGPRKGRNQVPSVFCTDMRRAKNSSQPSSVRPQGGRACRGLHPLNLGWATGQAGSPTPPRHRLSARSPSFPGPSQISTPGLLKAHPAG